MSWLSRDSGWGPRKDPVSNGRLLAAVVWTVVAFPFGLTYVVFLEVKALARRRGSW